MSSLNIKSLEEISFNDSLKNHNDIHSIIVLLVERVKKIPNYSDLNMNVDLIVYICKLIDQILVDSKLKNIDKLKLFIEIYSQIFPETSEKELKTIKAIIEYMHNIKELLPIKTNWQKIARRAKSFLKVILGVLSLSWLKLDIPIFTIIIAKGISFKLTLFAIFSTLLI